jgi:hypothetical protein
MPLELDAARFTTRLDDKLAVTPCLEFVLYLDVTDDQAMLDFYERCRSALGGQLTHFQAEGMRGYAKLNTRGNSLVPTWFKQPRPGKIDYHMSFAGCDLNEETSPATLLMRVMRRTATDAEQQLAKMRMLKQSGRRLPFYPTTDLRLTLPLDHPLAEPARLRDWVLEFDLLESATGFSGFAGYALNHMDIVTDSDHRQLSVQSLASLCRRYPGLGMFDGSAQSKIFRYRPDQGDILPRIKRANWLTLLCDRTVDAAGGADSLRSALGRDLPIEMDRLPHGFWIQAGPAPQHGDLAQRDFIPAYRRVAGALHGVRIEEIDSLGKEFMSTAANAWLNALDVAYD